MKHRSSGVRYPLPGELPRSLEPPPKALKIVRRNIDAVRHQEAAVRHILQQRIQEREARERAAQQLRAPYVQVPSHMHADPCSPRVRAMEVRGARVHENGIPAYLVTRIEEQRTQRLRDEEAKNLAKERSQYPKSHRPLPPEVRDDVKERLQLHIADLECRLNALPLTTSQKSLDQRRSLELALNQSEDLLRRFSFQRVFVHVPECAPYTR